MSSDRPRETKEVAAAARRMIEALSRRIGEEDPADLKHLADLEAAIEAARAAAIVELREKGSTDVQIGEALGITRQAVQQRYPRTTRCVGGGARWKKR